MNLTYEECIKILDAYTSRLAVTRDEHITIISALQKLRELLELHKNNTEKVEETRKQ